MTFFPLKIDNYSGALEDEDQPLLVAEHEDVSDEGDGGDGEEVGVGDQLAQVG